MLKAKAKAAATAAAQRRKAAAAAAAQQEAAAQQAQAAAAGVGISSTRSGRGIRPNVTQYWIDSAANILAPGGSIQRIGYDQTSFDEAYRVVALEQSPTPLADDDNNNNNNNEAGPSSRIGIFEDERTNESEANRGDAAEPAKEGESSFKLNKDDLAYITSNLEVKRDVAVKSLRAHRGDVVATLRDLTSPVAEAL
ncbi:hypothetical protein JCM3766R1_000020 [Sporobolomyces carnicolor]